MNTTSIDSIKEKALKILEELPLSYLDKYYSSRLMREGGLTIRQVEKRKFFKKWVETEIDITYNFANQVIHRYSLKKLAKFLSEYNLYCNDPMEIDNAETLLNTCKNIECVYNNHCDDEKFDILVQKIAKEMFSSVKFTKSYSNTDENSYGGIDYISLPSRNTEYIKLDNLIKKHYLGITKRKMM